MKKNSKIIIIAVLLISSFVFLADQKSLAADSGGIVPCGSGDTADCTLCHLIIGFERIFKYLSEILFTVTMVFIVVAGVLYMISSGNSSLMEWGKKAITLSLTGFAIFLCSWLIVGSVLTALGYKQVGSWWTFTCDTTQTVGPVVSGGGGSGNPGTSSSPPGTGCKGAVTNAQNKKNDGWKYCQSLRGQCVDKSCPDPIR